MVNPLLLDITIEPGWGTSHDAVAAALEAIVAEQGGAIRCDAGSIILGGESEDHLDGIVTRLRTQMPVKIGAPSIAYRETISRDLEHDFVFRQREPHPAFARILFRIEPDPAEAGIGFINVAAPANVPLAYAAAVEVGVRTLAAAGPLIGCPIVNLRITLIDGAYHDTDSSPAAFETAARLGLAEAMLKAGPVVREPIMDVAVTVSERHVGDIIGDLNARRGMIRDVKANGAVQTILAKAPLASMLGYVNALRAMTHGASSHTLTFSHYAEVPDHFNNPDGTFPPAMALRA